MRKRLFLLAGVLLNFTAGAFAQHRSAEDAMKIAQEFLNAGTGGSEMHAPTHRTPAGLQVIEAREFIADAGLQSLDEAFYVFNVEAGNGYVIVAADESLTPLIGYSDRGNLTPENVPSNMKSWLLSYVSESAAPSVREASYSGSVKPLCNTKWGQSEPYNLKCPSVDGELALTGCVATATAQIMKVHGFPAVGTGTVSYTTATNSIKVNANLSELKFDWSSMIDDYSETEYTEKQGLAVANLMYAVGASAEMDYDPSGSGTTSDLAAGALVRNFGYDKDIIMIYRDMMTDDDWHSFLINELVNGRPMVYDGVTSEESGHAFVMDGYEVRNQIPYYHINWGWDGYGDGYFRMGALEADIEDSENYSLSNSAIINIMPDNGITEYASFWQAEKISITPESVTSGGSKVEVELTNCYNFHNSTFNGTMKVYLVGAENEYLLGDLGNIEDVEMQSGFSATVPMSLPKNIKGGNYYLEVRSVAKGSSAEQRVYSANGRASFSVSSTDGISVQNEESKAVRVSDVNGRNFGTRTDAGLNSLNPGLYIVGGKKILVR